MYFLFINKCICLLLIITVCAVSCDDTRIKKLDVLPGTTIEQCINCMCYAKTGSWDYNLCGHQLITLAYWRNASTEENKNCILNTIKSYTEQFGVMNCNLDGIPNVIFSRFHLCLSHVITKESGGRYKRNKLTINQNVNFNIKQDVNGDNNELHQNLNLEDCSCSC